MTAQATPFFDYPRVAREAGIPGDVLAQIVASCYAEFPGDDMMASLHVLRICHAILDGRVTVEAVLDGISAEAKDEAQGAQVGPVDVDGGTATCAKLQTR